MKNKNNPSFNFTLLRSRKGRRIVFDLAAVLVPLLLIFGLILLLYGVFRSRKDSPVRPVSSWNKGIISCRVFDMPATPTRMLLPVLANRVHWGPLSIAYPKSWGYFFEKRFGGKTLSIQENLNAPYGMHIQIERLGDTTISTSEFGSDFLQHIGLYARAKGEILLLESPGTIFYTIYITPQGIAMSSIFLFIKRDDYLIKIVAYAPDSIYLARKMLFDAMLTTLDWDKEISLNE